MKDIAELMPAPQEPRAIGTLPRLWHLLTGDQRGRLQEERRWASLPREIKEAGPLTMLNTTVDYVEALALLPMPPAREEYLRRKLWWASNDHLRRESNAPALAADAARANMERLLAVLPATASILERVELYRQLGVCAAEKIVSSDETG